MTNLRIDSNTVAIYCFQSLLIMAKYDISSKVYHAIKFNDWPNYFLIKVDGRITSPYNPYIMKNHATYDD